METSNVSYIPTRGRSATPEWFEHDPDCRWIIDDKLHLLAANQYAREAILNHHCVAQKNGKLSFGNQDNNNKVIQTIQALISTDTPCKKKLVLRTLDGSWKTFTFINTGKNTQQIVVAMKNCDKPNNMEIHSIADAFELTQTEAQVLQLMMRIDQPKVIATEMGISIYTVRAHLRTIYAKMGARGHVAALKILVKLLH